MEIRSYNEYQEKIKPLEMLEKFNKLLKKNKPKDKELYAPPCQKYAKVTNQIIPLIIVKSNFDGNYYEIPLSEIINLEDLKEIDYNMINYSQCRYLKNLPKMD